MRFQTCGDDEVMKSLTAESFYSLTPVFCNWSEIRIEFSFFATKTHLNGGALCFRNSWEAQVMIFRRDHLSSLFESFEQDLERIRLPMGGAVLLRSLFLSALWERSAPIVETLHSGLKTLRSSYPIEPEASLDAFRELRKSLCEDLNRNLESLADGVPA